MEEHREMINALMRAHMRKEMSHYDALDATDSPVTPASCFSEGNSLRVPVTADELKAEMSAAASRIWTEQSMMAQDPPRPQDNKAAYNAWMGLVFAQYLNTRYELCDDVAQNDPSEATAVMQRFVAPFLRAAAVAIASGALAAKPGYGAETVPSMADVAACVQSHEVNDVASLFFLVDVVIGDKDTLDTLFRTAAASVAARASASRPRSEPSPQPRDVAAIAHDVEEFDIFATDSQTMMPLPPPAYSTPMPSKSRERGALSFAGTSGGPRGDTIQKGRRATVLSAAPMEPSTTPRRFTDSLSNPAPRTLSKDPMGASGEDGGGGLVMFSSSRRGRKSTPHGSTGRASSALVEPVVCTLSSDDERAAVVDVDGGDVTSVCSSNGSSCNVCNPSQPRSARKKSLSPPPGAASSNKVRRLNASLCATGSVPPNAAPPGKAQRPTTESAVSRHRDQSRAGSATTAPTHGETDKKSTVPLLAAATAVNVSVVAPPLAKLSFKTPMRKPLHRRPNPQPATPAAPPKLAAKSAGPS